MSHRRTPARWLAPLAILAALVAIFAIVSATTGDEEGGSTPAARESRDEGRTSTNRSRRSGTRTGTTSTTPASGRKTYRVRAGDTLAGIADQNGLTVEELQELNPGVDSNSLSIGQELRLAR